MAGLFFGYRLDTGLPDGIGYREEGATWRLPREAVLLIPYGNLRNSPESWFRYAQARNRFLSADIFAAWNEQELQFGIACHEACDVEIDIDADNNGWFSGNDNLNIRLRVRGVAKPEVTARVWDGGWVRGWNLPLLRWRSVRYPMGGCCTASASRAGRFAGRQTRWLVCASHSPATGDGVPLSSPGY